MKMHLVALVSLALLAAPVRAMGVKYDQSGNVTAVSAAPMTGANTANVDTNADALIHPNKYAYLSGALVLKSYLVLTSGNASAVANGVAAITVTITARLPSGAVDSANNSTVTLKNRATGTTSSVALVSGVATTSITSSKKCRGPLVAVLAGEAPGVLTIAFN